MRIGNYRLRYEIDDPNKIVLILEIIHRKDLEEWLRGEIDLLVSIAASYLQQAKQTGCEAYKRTRARRSGFQSPQTVLKIAGQASTTVHRSPPSF
jgi:hypothetical protein